LQVKYRNDVAVSLARFLSVPLFALGLSVAVQAMVWLYAAWRGIPEPYRGTISPRRAALSLLIPFYNAYWTIAEIGQPHSAINASGQSTRVVTYGCGMNSPSAVVARSVDDPAGEIGGGPRHAAAQVRREKHGRVREVGESRGSLPMRRSFDHPAELLGPYAEHLRVNAEDDVDRVRLGKPGRSQSRPSLRSWVFQIAHRRALDHLRRYDRRMGRPLDDLGETVAFDGELPEDAIARQDAVRCAIAVFLELPPLPRSCVILKDVLGHSIEEIALLLDLSTAAAKAALHRGRLRLRTHRDAAPKAPIPVLPVSATVARYAALFNARDWEGIRALLADEVRLDLVSRSQRFGRRDVGGYAANYARFDDCTWCPRASTDTTSLQPSAMSWSSSRATTSSCPSMTVW
jgi:hypothetical protein